jgi:NADP-dependent 3-hydroxy acid dehydrogenase YdfG
MKDLRNQVVVITGGSRGIGLESARIFAQRGAKVVLLGRSLDALEEAASGIAKGGGDVESFALDVTQEAAVTDSFAAILAKHGQIDILVNNAGTGFATDLSSCTMEDFRRIFETNVTGVFLCNRAVLPSMKARKSGHIINISSIVGKVANPNAPLYCASKHALNGYNSGLQQQVVKDNIRVSLVSPSAVDTAYWDGRQVDRSKFLQPSEVAEVIVFVASQPDGVLIKDIDITAQR